MWVGGRGRGEGVGEREGVVLQHDFVVWVNVLPAQLFAASGFQTHLSRTESSVISKGVQGKKWGCRGGGGEGGRGGREDGDRGEVVIMKGPKTKPYTSGSVLSLL